MQHTHIRIILVISITKKELDNYVSTSLFVSGSYRKQIWISYTPDVSDYTLSKFTSSGIWVVDVTWFISSLSLGVGCQGSDCSYQSTENECPNPNSAVIGVLVLQYIGGFKTLMGLQSHILFSALSPLLTLDITRFTYLLVKFI